MRSSPRALRSRVRLLFAAVALGVAVAACVDGITGGSARAPLNVVPSFQIDPSIADAAPPVNRIVLRAVSVETGAVLAVRDDEVDPSATQWVVELDVETDEAVEVIVEVELLNGDEVVWSGRAGPYTIEPGVTTDPLPVEVYRGPLDNLDVTGVAITGAPAQLLAGSNAEIVAEATVDPGSDATPTVFWSSPDPLLAMVTPSGTTATVTAVAAGEVEIFAAAGPASSSVPIEVLPRVSSVIVTPASLTLNAIDATGQLSAEVRDGFGAIDPGALVGWSSLDPTVAAVSPTGLVTAVGAGTTEVTATSFEGSAAVTVTVLPRDPGGDVTWLGLTADWGDPANWSTGAVPTAADNAILDSPGLDPVLDGAFQVGTLSLDDGELLTMAPGSELIVYGNVFATGDIVGDQASMVLVGAPVEVGGWVSVNVTVTGDVSIGDGANFETVDVAGAGAVLRIGSSNTTVEGAFRTSPGGALAMTDPAGVLLVGGHTDFGGRSSAGLLTAGVMRVSGDFVVGDEDEESFHATGDHTVVFEGPDPVSFAAVDPGLTRQRFQNVVFDKPALVTAVSDIAVAGYMQLTSIASVDASGYTVSIGEELDDDANGLDFGSLRLVGPVTTLPTLLPGDVAVASDIIWPVAGGTVGGDLTVEGTLTLLTNSLTVAGDAVVQGTLSVGAGQTFDVGGALRLEAGSQLDVDGDVTAVEGCVDLGGAIAGTGSHPCVPGAGKTWIGGAPADPTGWDETGNWSPAGVPTATDDVLIEATADEPILSADVAVASLTTVATSTLDLGGFVITVTRDLSSAGSVENGQVDLTGVGSALAGVVPNLRIAANRAVSGALLVDGSLTLDNADLDLAGSSVQVTGAMSVMGGAAQLVMRDPADALDVDGDALFDGGNATGALTDGTLRLGGSLLAASSWTAGSFVGSGAHRTVLDGAADQTVAFTTPGPTTQRFFDLTVENASGTVTFESDVTASGAVVFEAASAVAAPGRTLSVAGAFDDRSGAAVFSELLVIGNLTTISSPLPADLRVSANLTLPGDLEVQGDVRVANADLTVGANTLTAGDSLTVRGGAAQLRMETAGGVVDVNGHAYFDGGIHAGFLTAGTLRLAGDLTVGNSTTTAALAGTAAHETILDGNAAQLVTFSVPGATTQRFQDLTVENTAGTVTFASDFTTTGALTFVTGSTIDAAGRVMSVGGSYQDPGLGAVFAELQIIGALTALSSPVQSDVRVSANFTLPGDLEVQGDLRIVNFDLIVGANALTIFDSLTVRGGAAQLRMETAGGSVDVNGSALFDGGISAGFLREGTLSIAGDLEVNQSSTTAAFAGSIAHTTVFDGVGPQVVTFTNPGATTQRFLHLTVSNTASTVSFPRGFTANGDVLFEDGSSVLGPAQPFSVAGSYQDPGLGASFAELRVIGDLTALTSPLTADLTVAAAFTLPADLSVTGDVRVVNTDLIIGANVLTTSDSLTVRGGAAQLVMQTAGGVVDVNGDAYFDGGTQAGFLTQGTLTIEGDLTVAASSSSTSFVGTTAHTTVLDGPGAQDISFSTPGQTTQRFNDLTVSNGAGTVSFPNGFVATGDVLFVDGSAVDGAGQVFRVGGSYQDPGIAATFAELDVIGNLTVITSPLPADLRISTTLNLPAALSVQGDVRLDNADLILGSLTLTVADSLTVRGGAAQLIMQDSDGIVDVNGDAHFDGGAHAGFLTAGGIFVAGDMTVGQSSSSTAFVGTVGHNTIFDGPATQTVTFGNPGAGTQRFHHMRVTNVTASVTFTAGFTATGDVLFVDGSDVAGPGQVFQVGNVSGGSYADPGIAASFGELNILGNLTSIPSTIPADVRVSANFTLPGDLTVQGDLRVANADLIVGTNVVAVQDSLTVRGGAAQLDMRAAGGVMDVDGHAVFDGGTTAGFLTEGTLNVAGDLTAASTSSSSSFVATVRFTTILDGTGDQTLSFAAPGATAQRFQHLTITNGSGTINFATTAVVSGLLLADAVTLANVGGATTTALEARGTIDVTDATVDGLRVRLISPVIGSAHTLSNWTFTGMDPTVVQFYAELPGGVNFPLTMETPTFESTPTTGYHIQTERLSGTELFLMIVDGPTPLSLNLDQGLNTFIDVF